MSEARWTLLRVRLESIRDLVAWGVLAALVVGAIGSYATVQDLRDAAKSSETHLDWYRYVNAAVSGAGIPLLVAAILFSLVVLLTAGSRVTAALGEAALDDEEEDETAP